MATKRQQTPTRATGQPPKARRATTAQLIPFPPSRDTRFVAEVLETYQRVAAHCGPEAGVDAVDARHLASLRTRLAGLGATPEAIEFELAELETAVCDLSWRKPARGK